MGKVSKRLLLGILGAATSFGMILGGKVVVDSVDNGATEVAAAEEREKIVCTGATIDVNSDKTVGTYNGASNFDIKIQKGTSTNALRDSENDPQWRIYKGSYLSISFKDGLDYTITKIEFTNDGDDIWTTSSGTGYTLSLSSDKSITYLTTTGDNISELAIYPGNQWRISDFTIYYEAGEPAAAPESVSIISDSTITFDEEELLLNASVLPADADQSVTWSIEPENDSCIIDDGLFVGENKTDEDIVVTVVAASTVDPTIKDEIDITVKPKIMTGIEIVKMPTKTEYVIGSEFDPTGIEVQAVYKDGVKPADVTDEIEYSHGTFTELGEVEVIVTLKGTEFTASIKVNVVDRVVELFDVSGEKTSFNVGDAFTLGDNVEISAMWNDEVFEEIAADSEDLSVELVDSEDSEIGSGTQLDSSYEMSLADNGKYVLVSYKGAAVTYQISVKEPFEVTNGQFVKVDSTEDLSIGDRVVVGYKNNMMANYKSGDYISAFAFEHGDKFSLGSSDLNNIAVLELGEPFGSSSSSSTFSLEQISGDEEQYLYCSGEKKISASSNATGLSSSASWQIVKSKDGFEIISQISNNYQLQYNTGSPRFTCYKGTMKDVELYKFVTYTEEATNGWASEMMGSGICDTGVADSETWSLLELYYDDLSVGAQQLLQSYEADVSESASVLAQALYRYDYILDIYGTDRFNDYIGRGGTPSGAYGINHNGDDNIWAIAGLSLTGIVSAAALLVLRKKKRA